VLKFLPLASLLYPIPDPQMAFLDPTDLQFDDDDDLSTAMGTKTLAADDLIPEEFAEGSDRSQIPSSF
jgi:hypothetical protein